MVSRGLICIFNYFLLNWKEFFRPLLKENPVSIQSQNSTDSSKLFYTYTKMGFFAFFCRLHTCSLMYANFQVSSTYGKVFMLDRDLYRPRLHQNGLRLIFRISLAETIFLSGLFVPGPKRASNAWRCVTRVRKRANSRWKKVLENKVKKERCVL